MSLEKWKDKFYPVSADVAAREGTLNAIMHSLNKWEGARKEVLEEYGLIVNCSVIKHHEGMSGFTFDGKSCALCSLVDSVYWYSDYTCMHCPITKATGDSCEDAWQIHRHYDNPEPMINLLKQTLSWYLCEYNKGEIYEN